MDQNPETVTHSVNLQVMYLKQLELQINELLVAFQICMLGKVLLSLITDDQMHAMFKNVFV
jgi:hypothetical protein